MKNNSHLLCRIFIMVAIITIFVPLMVLMIWSVSERWAWPQLVPQVFSLRGLEEVVTGQALLILHSSITLSALVAFLAVVIGILTGRAIVFYSFPGREILRFLVLLPLIVPATVFGMGIHLLLIRTRLSDTIAGVILVHVICALPYTVNMMVDSTQAVGKKLEEQARVLGASGMRAFWEVTVPALLPAAVSAAAMAYITSFSQYFLTLLIGGGRVRTFTMIMVPYLQNGDRTIAAGYSLLFLLVTVMVFAALNQILRCMYPHGEEKLL